jgi:hypothetical protein
MANAGRMWFAEDLEPHGAAAAAAVSDSRRIRLEDGVVAHRQFTSSSTCGNAPDLTQDDA